MMNIYIMAVEERVATWGAMVQELEAQGACVHVVLDSDRAGPFANFKRVLRQALDDGHASFVILQDDLWIADDAVEQMQQIADLGYDGVINLFAMTSPKRVASLSQAWEAGTHWAAVRYSSWGQSWLFSWSIAERALRFLDERVEPSVRWDDTAMTWFCQEHRLPIMVAIPNLVQHGRVKSSLGHAGVRPSVCFRQKIGDVQWDTMSKAIKWSGSPIASRASYVKDAIDPDNQK